MSVKFSLIKFLDEARWQGYNNYDLPNYCTEHCLSESQKLLTHFLGYITDRQTPFRLIFEVGDFIFSDLAYYYSKGENIDDLLKPDRQNSFFVEKSSEDNKKTLTKSNPSSNDNKRHFVFKSRAHAGNNKILKDNGFKSKQRVYFASRFIPIDYVAIYCVLKNLAEYGDRDIVKYIQRIIRQDLPNENLLLRILYGLYLLGYKDLGTWVIESGVNEKSCLSLTEINACANKMSKRIKTFLEKGEIDPNFTKNEIFSAKRVLCYVRDLLKFQNVENAFANHFKKCLNDEDTFTILEDQLYLLELPGDVWNNNDKFYNCLFEGTDEEKKYKGKKKKVALNRLLRHIYEIQGIKNCYPEQFDVTFDFARNMCSKQNKGNCTYCPFEKDNSKIPDAFCLKGENEDNYCPFLLYACGYKTPCNKIKEHCPNK